MPRIGNVSLASRHRDIFKYGRLLRELKTPQFGGGVLDDAKKRIMEFKLVGKMNKAVNGLQVALKNAAKKTGNSISSFFNMFRSSLKKNNTQLGGGGDELRELRNALSEYTSAEVKHILNITGDMRKLVNKLLQSPLEYDFRALFFATIMENIFREDDEEYYIAEEDVVESAKSDKVDNIHNAYESDKVDNIHKAYNDKAGWSDRNPPMRVEVEKARDYIIIMAKLIFPRIYHNNNAGKMIPIIPSPIIVEQSFNEIINYTNQEEARPKFIEKYIAFGHKVLKLLNTPTDKTEEELEEILEKELEQFKNENLQTEDFPSQPVYVYSQLISPNKWDSNANEYHDNKPENNDEEAKEIEQGFDTVTEQNSNQGLRQVLPNKWDDNANEYHDNKPENNDEEAKEIEQGFDTTTEQNINPGPQQILPNKWDDNANEYHENNDNKEKAEEEDDEVKPKFSNLSEQDNNRGPQQILQNNWDEYDNIRRNHRNSQFDRSAYQGESTRFNFDKQKEERKVDDHSPVLRTETEGSQVKYGAKMMESATLPKFQSGGEHRKLYLA